VTAVGTESAATAVGWRNPLRDKRDQRMPRIAGPCAVVIFGVTGDLARKKLMPAIYDLANRGLLPPSFALVGFARRDWTDEDFAKVVYDAVKDHARTPFRKEVWDRLAEGIRFVKGVFDDEASWTPNAERAAITRSTWRFRRAPSRLSASSCRSRGSLISRRADGAGW
jgi:glucose-6-phosphate 1-dehydrogenase